MSYMGSKGASGVYQAIIALMPPHDTYIELYAGSAQVLRRKPEALASYAVEISASVLERIPATPRLKRVNSDARSFLDKFNWAAAGRALIYADPPYLHSTRTSKNRYRHEMSDAEHLDLLAQLRAIPASVILSGYPSALYDANLPGWNSREFQAMTRGGVRTEKLWFNFEPVRCHSTAFAGRDFTDRQRIKRKASRWAANYAALPPGERLAILSAILSADKDGDGYVAGTIDRSHTDAPDDGRRQAELWPSMVDPIIAQKRRPVAGLCNTLQRTSYLRLK